MRRIYLNIAAFLVLTAATIAWSVINLLHLDVVERPYVVTVEFEQSPGLREGYEVTYLGHAVGRIRDVELVAGMSEVQLAIDRGTELPAAVVAAARRRSAIGEPYVDLSPVPGSDADAGPRLADGDRISLERTTSPLQYGDLFRSLDTLVRRVDADALAVVTDELATALDGRGDDIRRIVDGTADLTATLSEGGDEIEALIDGVAEVTDVLATHRDALGSGIDSLAGLTDALEQARPSIEALAEEGPSTLALVNAVVDAADHAIVCTVDGTSVLAAVLDAEAVRSLEGLFQRSAAFADVIRLVQDPRDGIFRLYISPSGGSPPTVEFVERRTFPAAPEVPACPTRTVDVTGAPVADEAGAGAGGDRAGGGGPSGPPGPSSGDDPDLASGTSDERPGDSPLERVLGALRASLPALTLALVGGGLLYLWNRRRKENP
ncbi:MAG TPA: MCE family protein [Acidimicrobiales bacterium]|nr:MCE family protein [Acidimicrobiales bacterium]